MRFIITEQQLKKYVKSGPTLETSIIKFLDTLMDGAKCTVIPKPRAYGNLHQNWCKDGLEFLSVYYYFEDGECTSTSLLICKEIVKTIMSLIPARRTYVLSIISEWYEVNYAKDFAKEHNFTNYDIDDTEINNHCSPCTQEIIVPDNITDDEMIDYIVKNTLYKKEEVIERINNGDDLKEFYIHIREIQARNEIYYK